MRSILRFPGNLLHFLWLMLVSLVCGVIYLVARIGTWFIWPSAKRRRAVGTLRGWILRQAMASAGATFVKMGQVMSTRPDMFSPEVIAQLRRLQDRMPPFGYWRVKRIVEADLGPIADRFTEFDRRPVAAASVAQVHRARLKDGREVAVKVLRPSVRRQVERDAVILLGGAKLIAVHPKLRLSDPVGHTKEFVDAIHDQTDLQIEAANYTRFRGNFTGWTRATFPEVHAEHCSSRVLTMEFVRGTKVDALAPGDHTRLAETVKLVMFKMCFDDGFMHADMHPGNMMVVDSGELVIFDVGLAKQLQEDVLIQFIDMSKCMAMGNPEDLVGHLKRFHRYLGDVDWDAIGRDVAAFAERFRGQDTRTLDYGKLFNEMFAIGRKYKVQPVTDMAMVLVALVTAQGIGKMLNPDDNAFADVARYLIPVLMRRNEKVPDSDAARAAQATA